MPSIDATNRATSAWNRIQRNPTSITLDRDGSNLSAQTVRLTFGSRPATMDGVARSPQRPVTIFGVMDHATIADTDITIGDRFRLGDDTFEVIDVLAQQGSVQAYAERIAGG